MPKLKLKLHSEYKYFTELRVKLRHAFVQPQRTEFLAERIYVSENSSMQETKILGVIIVILELSICEPNS